MNGYYWHKKVTDPVVTTLSLQVSTIVCMSECM